MKTELREENRKKEKRGRRRKRLRKKGEDKEIEKNRSMNMVFEAIKISAPAPPWGEAAMPAGVATTNTVAVPSLLTLLLALPSTIDLNPRPLPHHTRTPTPTAPRYIIHISFMLSMLLLKIFRPRHGVGRRVDSNNSRLTVVYATAADSCLHDYLLARSLSSSFA